jgi:sterol desaturase/sphingolipid hydroxylase (fatty acid hydroxylase superfamily)
MYVAAVAFGVLTFTLVEYVHHRHGGHLRRLGQRLLDSHRLHHRDPREGGVTYGQKLRQRLPLVAAITPVFALAFWAALGVTSGAFATFGLVVGYLYSEWFHHRMHHRIPRGRVARWLWQHHYLHHLDGKCNFGFTSPLWDYVFGTHERVDLVPIPVRWFPEWPDGIAGFLVMGRRDADPATREDAPR